MISLSKTIGLRISKAIPDAVKPITISFPLFSDSSSMRYSDCGKRSPGMKREVSSCRVMPGGNAVAVCPSAAAVGGQNWIFCRCWRLSRAERSGWICDGGPSLLFLKPPRIAGVLSEGDPCNTSCCQANNEERSDPPKGRVVPGVSCWDRINELSRISRSTCPRRDEEDKSSRSRNILVLGDVSEVANWWDGKRK